MKFGSLECWYVYYYMGDSIQRMVIWWIHNSESMWNIIFVVTNTQRYWFYQMFWGSYDLITNKFEYNLNPKCVWYNRALDLKKQCVKIPPFNFFILLLPQLYILGPPIQLMGCFEVYPSTCWVIDLIMSLFYFIFWFVTCLFVSRGFISLWFIWLNF
jgi:hypothetical protein